MHESLILECDISTTLFGNIEESKEYLNQVNEHENYRGWKIFLHIPNGGIVGFDLINDAYDVWMGEDTTEDFGYHDRQRIINYAKSVIDEIEKAIAISNGYNDVIALNNELFNNYLGE